MGSFENPQVWASALVGNRVQQLTPMQQVRAWLKSERVRSAKVERVQVRPLSRDPRQCRRPQTRRRTLLRSSPSSKAPRSASATRACGAIATDNVASAPVSAPVPVRRRSCSSLTVQDRAGLLRGGLRALAQRRQRGGVQGIRRRRLPLPAWRAPTRCRTLRGRLPRAATRPRSRRVCRLRADSTSSCRERFWPA